MARECVDDQPQTVASTAGALGLFASILLDDLRHLPLVYDARCRHALVDVAASSNSGHTVRGGDRPTRKGPCPKRRSHPVEGGSANDYDYSNGDPINQFDLDGLCGRFGNPFKPCKPKDDPGVYGPKYFCGNVGCISYQTNPNSGYVQWGITAFNGGFGMWSVQVFVDGKLVDSKPLYLKGTPHGRLPRSIAPPGSVVTIEAKFVYACLGLLSCRATNVPNAYKVPD